MIALVLLIAVVIVVGGGLEASRRMRFGRGSAAKHHRALDTLGHITTQQVDHGTVSATGTTSSRLQNVRLLATADPTQPRIHPAPIGQRLGAPRADGAVADEAVRLVAPEPPDVIPADGWTADGGTADSELADGPSGPVDAALDRSAWSDEPGEDEEHPAASDGTDGAGRIDPVLDEDVHGGDLEDSWFDEGIGFDELDDGELDDVAATVEDPWPEPDEPFEPRPGDAGADDVAARPAQGQGVVDTGPIVGEEGFRVLVDNDHHGTGPHPAEPAMPADFHAARPEDTRAQLAALARSGGVQGGTAAATRPHRGRQHSGRGRGGSGGRAHRHPRRRTAVVALAVAVVGLAAVSVGILGLRHAPARHRAIIASPVATAPPTTAPPLASLLSKTSSTATYQVTGSPVISLEGSAACWMEVRHGNQTGPLLFEGVLQAGQHKDLNGPVWVRLGNPPAVAVLINGSPLSNPSLSSSNPFDLQFQ